MSIELHPWLCGVVVDEDVDVGAVAGMVGGLAAAEHGVTYNQFWAF